MTENHSESRKIFLRAAEIQNPRYREQFLEKICEDDADLRSSVEEQLDSCDEEMDCFATWTFEVKKPVKSPDDFSGDNLRFKD